MNAHNTCGRAPTAFASGHKPAGRLGSPCRESPRKVLSSRLGIHEGERGQKRKDFIMVHTHARVCVGTDTHTHVREAVMTLINLGGC